MRKRFRVDWGGYTSYTFTDAKLAMNFANYWNAELKFELV